MNRCHFCGIDFGDDNALAEHWQRQQKLAWDGDRRPRSATRMACQTRMDGDWPRRRLEAAKERLAGLSVRLEQRIAA